MSIRKRAISLCATPNKYVRKTIESQMRSRQQSIGSASLAKNSSKTLPSLSKLCKIKPFQNQTKLAHINEQLEEIVSWHYQTLRQQLYKNTKFTSLGQQFFLTRSKTPKVTNYKQKSKKRQTYSLQFSDIEELSHSDEQTLANSFIHEFEEEKKVYRSIMNKFIKSIQTAQQQFIEQNESKLRQLSPNIIKFIRLLQKCTVSQPYLLEQPGQHRYRKPRKHPELYDLSKNDVYLHTKRKGIMLQTCKTQKQPIKCLNYFNKNTKEWKHQIAKSSSKISLQQLKQNFKN